MSHDQRPAKLRVVQDAAPVAGRRRDDPKAVHGKPGSADTAAAVPANASAKTGAEASGLALVPAMLFLIACIAGGVAFALVRPFGLG